MASLGRIDELVKDYLLFRGFTNSLKTIEHELKTDKDRGFRVDKIMEQLISFISSYDLNGLREYWSYLDQRIFCRLEQIYSSSLRKLEISLFRYYLVYAIQNGHMEKVSEFFEKLSSELQHQPEWKEWFALPFIKTPEENSTFAVFFTKQWQDTYLISLHNFLSVIFQSMPVPTLLSYEEDQRKLARLKEENATYRKSIIELLENKGAENAVHVPPILNPAVEELISPTGPAPGEASVDLMDDFYVISQDTTLPEPISSEKMIPKTNQIKTFIKNIGLPSSPIMGKKSNMPTARKPATLQGVNKEESQGNKKEPLLVKAKSKSVSTGGNFGQPTEVKLRSFTSVEETAKSETRRKSSDQSLSSEKRPNMDERDAKKDVPSSFVRDSTKRSVLDAVAAPELIEEHSQYILLSQEEYNEHRSSISHCLFSSSGNTVATADVDGVVKVWSLQPSPVTLTTVMSKSMLLSLEWIPKTDRMMLLGNKAGSIRLFDIKEKKTLKEASVDPSFPRIVSLCCHPSGSSFVCSAAGKLRGPTATSDITTTRLGKLLLWDLKSMTLERTLPITPSPVAMNCMSYNHNGQLLITGGADGLIRLYDMNRYECLGSWGAHSGEVFSIQFSADEASCYSMGGDNKFIQWSIHKPSVRLNDLVVHQGACGPFVISGACRQVRTPKGKLFAVDNIGQHALTCAGNGGLIYKICKEKGLERSLVLAGHKTPVTCLDWSSSTECRMCVTGDMEGKVRVSTLLTK